MKKFLNIDTLKIKLIQILKYLSIFIYVIFLFSNAYAFTDNGKGAQSDGRQDSSFLEAKNSNFQKGKDALKQAIKFKKKNDLKKANKRFTKALEYFASAYKEAPDNVEVLSFLGFAYYLVGDVIMSEIYYQQGLDIDPQNNLINQRLGELYFNTKRTDLAKERLKKLVNCKCEEFYVLNKIISEEN